MREFMLVFIGGGLGSALRFYIGRWTSSIESWNLAGTLISNVIACFTLGFLMSLMITRGEDTSTRLFLAVGFCGGFSTFSTFSWEIFELLQQQRFSTAILYVVLSLVVGLVSVSLGYYLQNVIS